MGIVAVAASLALPSAAGAAVVDLASAPGSVRIDGAASEDIGGFSVAAAGDVNGDGVADLIVGAPFADNNGRPLSGSAYVVFGGQSPADVDLQDLGAAGFRIDGAASADRAGNSVAAAGDVNGDGRADLIVGAPFANNTGRPDSGSAYVVLGGRNPGDVDLGSLGPAAGFRIDGAASEDQAGNSVAAAGDVNGDGRADLIVGALGADNNGRPASGSAYVVFGGQNPATVDLQNLGAAGLRIDGAASGDRAGRSVAAAGDVNGDGVADLIVGAGEAGNNGRQNSGSAYVVFGAAQPLPSGQPSGQPASNEFSFGKLKRNEKRGTAIQVVKAPGPGTLKLGGRGLFIRVKRLTTAGAARIGIQAKGEKKKRLFSKGRVKLRVSFTFTPTGGTPRTKAKMITLIKKR
jgi:FG-GAP repeat